MTYQNDLYVELAKIGKSLSSERRLEIMDLLVQGPKTVEKIAELTKMSVANTSRHLQVLRSGNLVERKRDGNHIYYGLASSRVVDLFYLLRDVGEDQLERISQIKEDFEKNDVYAMSLDAAYNKAKSGEIELIDVRPADEYATAHIAEAKNIPLPELKEKLDTLPVHEAEEGAMTVRQKICLSLFVFTIGFLLYGTMKLGWYIDEIAAMFLMMMIITGVVGGYGATKICKTFIKSTQSMVSSMLVVGFTRGILLTMQDAMISDTIVYYLSQLLNGHSQYFSAAGMLAIQNVINFFITGSSSQATITMPIMTPVADIVGVSRQTAVLAYHFGDGFSNMFWPTACALECGLMGVPINKWYKFMTPLFCIMMVLQVVFILISVVVYA